MQQVRLHHFIARRLFLNMPFPVAVHPHAVTPFFSLLFLFLIVFS